MRRDKSMDLSVYYGVYDYSVFGLARKFNLVKNGLNLIKHSKYLETANTDNKIRVVLQGQLDKLYNTLNKMICDSNYYK